jgi:hypothetical protein
MDLENLGGDLQQNDCNAKRLRALLDHDLLPRLTTFPPLIARAHGEIGMIGKQSCDTGVEQRVDFRLKVTLRRDVAGRS